MTYPTEKLLDLCTQINFFVNTLEDMKSNGAMFGTHYRKCYLNLQYEANNFIYMIEAREARAREDKNNETT